MAPENEQSKPEEDPDDPLSIDWETREEQAWKTAIDALLEFRKVVYMRGRTDERGALRDVFRKWAEENAEQAALIAPRPTLKEIPKRRTSPPANELVLNAIRKRPGMRGVALLQHLEREGTPLHERTMRTALHRLKTARPPKLVNVEGRWYPPDAAPASMQPRLMEDDDPE